MNPFQKNKIDVNSLSPDEQRLFRLYGKLPSKADHLAKSLKERKYFDSGDYALSKAGQAGSVDTGSVGSQHPLPENIPHLASPPNLGLNGAGGPLAGGTGGTAGPGMGMMGGQSGSPVKESSFLNRETSAYEVEAEAEGKKQGSRFEESVSPPPAKEGIPIRR